MNKPEIMTLEDVGDYLRLDPVRVRAMVEEGEIPGAQIGETWRFRRQDIEAWLNRKLGVNEPPKTHPLSLSAYLAQNRVILLRQSNKKGALMELIAALAGESSAAQLEELTAQVFYRESLMSTGIGMHTAVPHVRLRSVSDITMAVGLAPDGLNDYESLDGRPVHLVFLIAAAATQHADYLRLLAGITGRLRDTAWREALLTAPDASVLYDRLKE